ncbi:hypothetical protein M1328_00620 [Patescibacteria group bacterium]|nr:hypothetical protein [Patescibacteria group bacterium]
MIESTGPVITAKDQRRHLLLRPEQKIPDEYKKAFSFETFKALRMAGIKLGEADEFLQLSREDARLVEAMMPYTIDHGCLNYLEPLHPLPKDYDKKRPDLSYDNGVLDPVPVLSSSVLPYLAQNGELNFASVDGEGIYSHNEVNNLEADRVIRKMLLALKNQFALAQATRSSILRFKGDHFVVVDENVKPDINYFIDKVRLDRFDARSAEKFTGFRIDPSGRILLDAIRMHEEKTEINERTVTPFEKSKDIKSRSNRLLKNHPELKYLVDLIGGKDQNEADILLGIVEGNLFDPRLQKVAEKYDSKNFKVRVFNDMEDMQNHVVSDNSGFVKFDFASSLKSVNAEPGFGEKAGDAVLTGIYDQMLKTIRKKLPAVKEITGLRRWGDFYFIDEKGTCGDIARTLLEQFGNTPYLLIKKTDDKHEKFHVSFIKKPPRQLGSDSYIIPLLPIVGIDEEIRLQHIDRGTDISTADAIRTANELTFSTRLKVVDEEIRNMRARMISERLDKLDAVDIEFILFKMMNPDDSKRGLVRLRKLLEASDDEIAQMKSLLDDIKSKADGAPSSRKRVEVIREMIKNGSASLNGYLNLLFDATRRMISREEYKKYHNGVRTLTSEGAIAEVEDIKKKEEADLLSRTKPSTNPDLYAMESIRKRLTNLIGKSKN